MRKKNFKNLFIIGFSLLVWVPLVGMTKCAAFAALPMFIALIIISFLMTRQRITALLTNAVIGITAGAITKSIVPLIFAIAVIVPSLVLSIMLERSKNVYVFTAGTFISVLSIAVAGAIAIALISEDGIAETITHNLDKLMPKEFEDLISRYIIIGEYGSVNRDMSEYFKQVGAMSFEEVQAIALPLISQGISNYGIQWMLAICSLISVTQTFAVYGLCCIPALHTHKAEELGVDGIKHKLAGANQMYIPSPHGKILSITYVICGALQMFGAKAAALPMALLGPLFLFSGATMIWFILRMLVHNTGTAVIILIILTMLCGVWIFITAGLFDAAMGWRYRFAEYIEQLIKERRKNE